MREGPRRSARRDHTDRGEAARMRHPGRPPPGAQSPGARRARGLARHRVDLYRFGTLDQKAATPCRISALLQKSVRRSARLAPSTAPVPRSISNTSAPTATTSSRCRSLSYGASAARSAAATTCSPSGTKVPRSSPATASTAAISLPEEAPEETHRVLRGFFPGGKQLNDAGPTARPCRALPLARQIPSMPSFRGPAIASRSSAGF
jgi:hypothetical protein